MNNEISIIHYYSFTLHHFVFLSKIGINCALIIYLIINSIFSIVHHYTFIVHSLIY
jgi:hypothetical protein